MFSGWLRTLNISKKSSLIVVLEEYTTKKVTDILALDSQYYSYKQAGVKQGKVRSFMKGTCKWMK